MVSRGERILEWGARAEAAFPGVKLERSVFAAYVEGRTTRTDLPEGDEGAGELWLACALRAGAHGAAEAFEERYVAALDRVLGHMRLGASELDEVKQRVREKLLLPDAAGQLRVEEYAGRGRLGGLVHVVATREAHSLLRRTRREVPVDEDELAQPGAERWDAGLELARERYREAFRPAFADAVAKLAPRERNLLRMHLLGGVTLEHLAQVYGVHRATVVRWLAAARARVLDATREGLRARLRVRPEELESLMGWVQSRLDVSVERLLRTMDEKG